MNENKKKEFKMNIGIIYYSKSGNTKSVVERLYKKLSEKSGSVSINEITISGDIEKGFEIDNNPGLMIAML